MSPGRGNKSAVAQWVVVAVVGVLVVGVVLGLQLIPRLNAGQKVINAARPAFTTQSLHADVVGIKAISTDVNMADPIATPQGGASAEVPAVVAYVAKKEGITPAQALALLQKDFPHTTALLEAIPLSAVTAELPGLVQFLATTLKLTPTQVAAALQTNFPALAQAITNLPILTAQWDNTTWPAGRALTTFDGKPVTTVPELRDYFQKELIPAVAAQKKNFDTLSGTSTLNWIAPLLLVVGIIVIIYAIVMIVLWRRPKQPSRRTAIITAAVVPVVGVVVVALVIALNLVPRTNDGQKLINGLKPAFNAQRVAGTRAGINLVNTILKTEDPIMTPAGGAAAEVPKLVAFVSTHTGLTPAQVVAALQKNFPHVTALLGAIPLTAVTAEFPKLAPILAPAFPAVPHLAQTIANAPTVTSTWNNIPGHPVTFSGATITSLPGVGAYFSSDVIPVLETQQVNFTTLAGTSNIDFIGPLVLLVGIVVIAFGALMVTLAVEMPSGADGGAARTETAEAVHA